MNTLPISEDDLQAWVDARLPAARLAEVEAYLEAHPDEAARLSDYQRQTRLLHERFHPVLEEEIPEALQRAANGMAATVDRENRPFFSRWAVQRLAAAIAIALLGGVAGWFGRGQVAGDALAQRDPLPQRAAIAHAVYSPDVRRPVELGADQEALLVKWLSKRLGVALRPPALGALGYELIGGRLLPGSSGPVAQFMYQEAGGQRLTLYVSPENPGGGDTAFRFAREGSVNVFYWVDGSLGYALSGALDRQRLARVANAVYWQLDRR